MHQSRGAVNGPAVRSALERLNARLYKSNTPAYQMLCERNGKTPQDRLTVSELLEAVIARTMTCAADSSR